MDGSESTNNNPFVIASGLVLAIILTALAVLAYNASFENAPEHDPNAVITVTPTTPLFKSPVPTNLEISTDIPEFEEEVVMNGLEAPWDIIWLSENDDHFLLNEKRSGFVHNKNGVRTKIDPPEDLVSRGEGGLLGMAVDPEFNQNGFIYVCYNSIQQDVRLVRFVLNDANPALSDATVLIEGMPAAGLGRHSGCQLEFGTDGFLWVGTGDAAMAENPQDLQSLGGKILRIDRDGNAAFDNLQGGADLRIYSYGHRNTQGLGFFNPAYGFDAPGISIEHGSNIDDEVNPLLAGNFGWDPDPVYQEAGVPMTDLEKFPDAIPAIWSSGNPTIASSGGTIIQGDIWKAWNQSVAVAAQKGSHVMIVTLDRDLSLVSTTKILDGTFGRIRTVQQAPSGDLYILTDVQSAKEDMVVKLTPN